MKIISEVKFIIFFIKKFYLAKNTNFNKCFSQKFSSNLNNQNSKNNIFVEEEIIQNEKSPKDINMTKFNDIIDNLNTIYKDKNLKELANKTQTAEIKKLAGTFITELEVFLSTNEKI